MIHAITWADLKGMILTEKKPISKGYILYDATDRTFQKWQKIEMENRLTVVKGIGKGMESDGWVGIPTKMEHVCGLFWWWNE